MSVVITDILKKSLRDYFDYVVSTRYTLDDEYPEEELSYIKEYLFDNAYNECEKNKHNYNKLKKNPNIKSNNAIGSTLKSYLSIILRSNVLTEVTKINRLKGYREKILKPLRREERLNKLLK
ncbi:MAG: hypothetical protein SLAVMIC_00164 [uncultured marine phage]|uniref:Uncharacterized protein n=1 Tax=uncultured marine phage TaxID=707152 RepID=A0A8D9FRB8_9VIRU|nr:MAG: hypothetical protein SLAVMIC_00164 [uncultured marine phage]